MLTLSKQIRGFIGVLLNLLALGVVGAAITKNEQLTVTDNLCTLYIVTLYITCPLYLVTLYLV